MILGIGIDLEECSRIGNSIARFGDRFIDKLFSPREIAFCRGKANETERFAARFAAKEAAFKALRGTWAEGLTWKDFEVVNEPGGAPRLELHGAAAAQAKKLGVQRSHLSFSHTREYVSAIVVLEGDRSEKETAPA